MMNKVSEKQIQGYQEPITVSESLVNPKGKIVKKSRLNKSSILNLIGLIVMASWVISTYFFTPQLMGQVIPAALIISTVLLLKFIEVKPYKVSWQKAV